MNMNNGYWLLTQASTLNSGLNTRKKQWSKIWWHCPFQETFTQEKRETETTCLCLISALLPLTDEEDLRTLSTEDDCCCWPCCCWLLLLWRPCARRSTAPPLVSENLRMRSSSDRSTLEDDRVRCCAASALTTRSSSPGQLVEDSLRSCLPRAAASSGTAALTCAAATAGRMNSYKTSFIIVSYSNFRLFKTLFEDIYLKLLWKLLNYVK